ncbi:MAG: WYL domain-containing protein [Rectinemataceae bacterium]
MERGVGCDGEPYTDITVPVADWTELLGRVLSFGSAAEALAPPELRKAWKDEIRRMGKKAGI